MNRLQNAQKSLVDSLAALESAVAQTQPSISPAGASDDGSGGVATMPSMDLGQLSQDVTAIEADLDRAIQMLAELTAQHPTGDGA
ncbi:hypothetical protein N9Y31_01445 [Alphaproteobacteria bacterium]|nr:hypothetical protein [Alphaproteobacteria bacterium]